MVVAAACGTDDDDPGTTTGNKTPIGLTAPEFCAKCHPQHYDEWRTSMHAYGTLDPVFVAMNKLAMKQTKGKVGQFCVTCHSPSAAFRNQTPIGIDKDGNFNMPFDLENPVVRNGVQCITCHSVKGVTRTANGQLTLAEDVLFGPTASDKAQQAHAITKSPLLVSSTLCGACHNVINPAGTLVENTFSEWYNSHYNSPGDPKKHTRCQDCHMATYKGRITDDSDVSTLHRHTFVGVDQALIKGFPGKAQQAELVRKLLQNAATMKLDRRDASGQAVFRVTVINDKTGHALPSGATADRQMWVEMKIWADDKLVYQSGMLDANGDLMDGIKDHSLKPDGDPDLMLFNQVFLGGANCPKQVAVPPPGVCKPVPLPWQAKRSEDYLIPVGAARFRDYSLDASQLTGKSVRVSVRLLFRTFPPHLIRTLQKEGVLKANALEPLPIVEMNNIQCRYTAGSTTCTK